jgi:hypothetical protein
MTSRIQRKSWPYSAARYCQSQSCPSHPSHHPPSLDPVLQNSNRLHCQAAHLFLSPCSNYKISLLGSTNTSINLT